MKDKSKAQCSAPERAFFAKRLRDWRKARGLGLKQVAAKFGVTEGTWSRWENAERCPTLENLRLLAEFIGTPVCCFFYADEKSCPQCRHAQEGNRNP
jgi:transcriptional regulator with XRE-family HTH domain